MPAIIDIGSNSVILLITKKTKSGWRTIIEKNVVTRFIDIGGEKKTLNTIIDHLNICKKYNEKDIHIIGTASFRTSKGKDFVKYLKKIVPAKVKTLSSKNEAKLAMQSATSSFEKPLISMDIGGGSTDIAIVSKSGKRRFHSFENLGAIKLKKFHGLYDRPTRKEILSLFNFIDKQIDSISPVNHKIIVSGGTATTLASINLKLKSYDAKKIHGHKISLKKLKSIFTLLCSKKPSERKNIVGLSKDRADIIVFGTAILISLIEKLGGKSFITNHKGIRWGYLENSPDLKRKLSFRKNSCSSFSAKSLKRKRN